MSTSDDVPVRNELSGGAEFVVQAGAVHDGIHFTVGTPRSEVADFALAPRMPSPPAAPLALPQRRVAADRLHGREKAIGVLVDHVLRRARGEGRDCRGVHALCGLGGTGKTTLALEAAHRVAEEVRSIWWVSASDPASLMASLRAVAVRAGAAPVEFEHLHPADVLWRGLDGHPEPWLLVLDNVDDLATVSAEGRRLVDGTGWLRAPSGGWGTVVVTSRETRAERWGSWVARHEVEALGVRDAARVLLDLAPQAGDARAAEALAEALGGLPLALDLAGTYLGASSAALWPDDAAPTTFHDYRAALADQLPDIAPDPGDYPDDTPERVRRDIVATWDLSLDLLARQGHDAARPLLWLLSCFADAPLPFRALLDLDVLRSDARFIGLTGKDLRDALQGLVGLRLATVVPGGVRALEIHPVVRASNRSGRIAEYVGLVVALLDRATAHRDPEEGDDPVWHALVPHSAAAVRTLATERAAVAPVTEDAAARPVSTGDHVVLAASRQAVQVARYQFAAGFFPEVERNLQTVLGVLEVRLGPRHPETLHVSRHLARAYLENGRNRDALAMYEELFRRSRDVFREDDPHMLSIRRGWGRSLSHCGRLHDAKAVFDELVALLIAHDWPDDSYEVVSARHERAAVLIRLALNDEAEREYRDVLEVDRRVRGETDRLTLDSRFSLARLLRAARRHDAAEEELRDIVAVAGATYPAEHPTLLAMRHERARNLRDMDRLDTAEQEFRAIGEVTRTRLGEEHPATVAVRHELATVLHRRGLLDAARAEYTDVWSINTRRLGPQHPDTLMSRHNIALTWLDAGAGQAAALIFQEVLDARLCVLGPDHPDTRTTARRLEAARTIHTDDGTVQHVEPGRTPVQRRDRDDKHP